MKLIPESEMADEIRLGNQECKIKFQAFFCRCAEQRFASSSVTLERVHVRVKVDVVLEYLSHTKL